jgi:hypothetical protein
MTEWLIAIVLFLGGIIAAYLRGQSIGKTQAKSETQANDLKAIQTAKGIENEVDGLSDADLNKRYSKWVRDSWR